MVMIISCLVTIIVVLNLEHIIDSIKRGLNRLAERVARKFMKELGKALSEAWDNMLVGLKK